MKLEKRVAIVTGASRGIGKAISLAFAREGARVVVVARSETEGLVPGTIHATVNEILEFGGDAVAIRADMTEKSDIEKMVQETIDRYGRVDILVNNAGLGQQSGVGLPVTFMECTVEKWDLVMAVNLRGTFLCCKAVLPLMKRQRSGNIINVSSVFSYTPSGVTKAAIERLTVALAHEIRPHNIAVNALRPDFTYSEGFRIIYPDADRTKWQMPEVWGPYAVFIASQEAASLTGQCLSAEDLNRLMPRSTG